MKATKDNKTGKLTITVKKGALHKDLGVPAGDKIPDKKLAIDTNDSPKEKARKQFAINAAKWKK